MLGHGGDGGVQVCSQLADFTGLLCQRLLPPHQRHRLGDGEQVDRPGEQDALFKGPAQQRQIMLHRGGEEILARNEHHHEIGRRAELVPIGLVAQPAGMGAHGGGVALERRQPRRFIGRLQRRQIVIHRAFGIDDQLPPARQVDDRIRPLAAAIPRHMGLQGKIDIGAQPGHLQRVEKLLLAPAPGGLAARAQRRDQLGGLVAHLALAQRHGCQLLLQAAIGFHPGLLDRLQRAFIARQRFRHRLQQRLQPGFRNRLLLGEARLGPLQELRLRRFQRLASQRLEALGGARHLGGKGCIALILLGLQRLQLPGQPLALGLGLAQLGIALGQHLHFHGAGGAFLLLAAHFHPLRLGLGPCGIALGAQAIPLGPRLAQWPRPERPAQRQSYQKPHEPRRQKLDQHPPPPER